MVAGSPPCSSPRRARAAPVTMAVSARLKVATNRCAGSRSPARRRSGRAGWRPRRGRVASPVAGLVLLGLISASATTLRTAPHPTKPMGSPPDMSPCADELCRQRDPPHGAVRSPSVSQRRPNVEITVQEGLRRGADRQEQVETEPPTSAQVAATQGPRPRWQADAVKRLDPPPSADERVTLEAFLNYQRATWLMKTEGLNQEQLAQRCRRPSSPWPDCSSTWPSSRTTGSKCASVAGRNWSRGPAPRGSPTLQAS